MIAIDIEASGTNYEKHSIVSLGAVDMADQARRFYGECRIWDGAHFMEEALGVNGFSKEQITDGKKQSEEELIEKFLRWIGSVDDRTLLGQNVSFDRDFLLAACARAHIDSSAIFRRTIDTHTLAIMHMTKQGISMPLIDHHSAVNLDAILTYVGIPEEPKPHNALTGALSHAEVAHRLLYDKKFLPEFEQFEIPWLSK